MDGTRCAHVAAEINRLYKPPVTDSKKAGTGRPGFFCSGSRIGCIFARDTRATTANSSGSRIGCFDLDFASDGIATAERFRGRHACHFSHARSIVAISP
jgi:hypothetical protein